MKPTKSILIGLATTASIMGGVDASVLNEQPLSRVEMVANERVEAKQIGNLVETTLPWKDQAGLKVKVDLGEPTLVERFKDKRNKEVITEKVTDFEGGFKVDILLNEKPDTNVFCYDIDGAENYDFFYQPPLTAEEIAEGASRPPEIEGSYAIYHKTLKNHQLGKENYATGKVMHIPRPQVWSLSDVETKVWADMTYSEKDGLCVTVPQEFLDIATYPVRVDPTFGYTSIGASDSANNLCRATRLASGLLYTASSGDTIVSFSIYSKFIATEYSLGAYLTDGTLPLSVVLATSSIFSNGSAAWFTSATTSIALSAGSVYSVASDTGGSALSGVRVFDVGAADSVSGTAVTECASSWSEVSTLTGIFSAYTTYTTSSVTSSTTSTMRGSVTVKGGVILK